MAGLCVSACSAAHSPPGTPTTLTAGAAAFEKYEVVTDSAERQTVLTGFLFGGAVAELAVVHIGQDASRNLRIHTFDGDGWKPVLEATLRPGVSFVDVVEIDGRDRLITYEPGRLHWFDPGSAIEGELLAVTSNFVPPRRDEIPHVDISRDVNGDGREDLVVPDADGFEVFVQLPGGAFADPVKIGPPSDMSGIYGADGYRYDPWSRSRIHEIDYDRDGLGDLVFWREDHFEVHTQDERGRFSPVAYTFETDVPFDSDDPHSLAAGAMQGRVLHSIADLNADGVADLVILSLEGRDIASKRSAYEVHLGRTTPDGGTTFETSIDFAIASADRIQLGMDRHDFDADGRIDLLITTIDIGHLEYSLWKRIRGFMGDDIHLGLEFYRMQGGLPAGRPDAIRRLALDGPPSLREPGWVPLDVVLLGATHVSRSTRSDWPRAFNNTLRIGDVTGDGLSDLVIGSHPGQLEVYVGVRGPELFARRPETVVVDVPNDEEYIRLVDLDRDGRQDILMHHPFTLRDAHGAPLMAPGTERQRLTVLIAR